MNQFEAAASANMWTAEEKATSLVIALREDALNILQAIPEQQQRDYKYLVEMRYGASHLQQVYYAQLKDRYQKSGGALQEFETDIARIVRLAYPTAPDSLLEQLAVESFTDGLRDGETQQTLRLAHPKTIDDALARALEFEAAKETSKGHTRARAVSDSKVVVKTNGLTPVRVMNLNEF